MFHENVLNGSGVNRNSVNRNSESPSQSLLHLKGIRMSIENGWFYENETMWEGMCLVCV